MTVLSLCRFQDDPMTNLNTAFDVAEKYLDIPKMLDAEGEKAASGKKNDDEDEKRYIFSCVQRPECSLSEVRSRLMKPKTFRKCFLSDDS